MPATRPLALSQAELRFIDLDHCRLAYRTVGVGPALLLIHGYPLSGMTFRHLVPRLAEHFTCFIPDLPGLGETKWTDKTDFGFASQAVTLRCFVDALGLQQYSIVAHDTGGTIARRLAIIDGNRLIRMVLIGTEIPGIGRPGFPFSRRSPTRNAPRSSGS